MNIFAGTYRGRVYLSTTNGTSCAEVNSGLANLSVLPFACNDTHFVAGTFGDGVWRKPILGYFFSTW